MEIRLTTPVDKLRASVIGFNNAELTTQLSNALVKYKGITYDDSAIATAKKDRASLNNLKGQIDSLRRDVKAEWNEPYNAFDTQIKQLTAMVDEPIATIDAQVKDYEERQRTKKRDSLSSYFRTHVEECADFLKFDEIFQVRWLNVTVSEAEVIKEIDEIISKFRADLQIVGQESGEFKDQLYDYFLRTRDLAATFAEKQRLTLAKEATAKAKALTEERSKQAADASRCVQEAKREEPKPEQSEIYTISFAVEGTAEQMHTLSEFLKTNGYKYRRI